MRGGELAIAATVEGAFVILDRASPAIRGIRDNALQADAAVKKLGLSLDELGARKKITALDNLNRQIKTVGRTTEAENKRAANSFRDLDRRTTSYHGTLKRLHIGLKDVSSEIWKLARPAGMLVGMGTALSVAAQGIGALSGGVVALLPRLVDLTGAAAPAIAGFAGIGASVLTAKLAFGGLSQAMGGNRAAMRLMTPEARQLITHLRQLRPMLREFRISAQGGLFGGINQALDRAGGVAPTINRILRSTSANLGGIVNDAAARLTQPGTLRDVESIVGQGGVMVRQAATGLLNLGDALRHVAVAARPFTQWMTTMIVGWTRHIAATAEVGRETGRLAGFFNRTRSSLTLFAHIAQNLWETFRNLLRDARPLGDELWKAAERTTRGWARVTGTIGSRTRLTQDFLMMGKSIRDIFNLVGELGGAIFRLGAGGGLDKTVNGLRQLVPSLERIFNYMGNTFGPAMAQTLVSFANVLTDLTGATGPFTVLLKTLTMTFNLIDGIVNLAGPFKSVFATALSTALIVRYLAKLGLLEIGWKRVAVAAGEAAVAEGAASGGGIGGVGIGLGPVGRGIFAPIRGFRAMRAARGAYAAGTGARFVAGAGGVTDLAAGGGMLGRAGGLAGIAGLGGRALGVAGRFALPLLAINAGIGMLTAGRSGGIGHQALQTGFGGINALGMGIPGHFIHGLETPAEQAARMIGGDQSALSRDLAQADRGRQGIARLTAELAVLQSHAQTIDDTRTQEARDYSAQLQQEITARRTLIAQLTAEAQQRGATRGLAERQALNRVFRQAGGGAAGLATAAAAGITALGRYPGAGTQAVSTRTSIEQGILGATTGAMRAQFGQQIIGAEAQQGRRIRISGGQIFTGADVGRLRGRMTLTDELRREAGSAALTPLQQQLSAALQAGGMTPGNAQQAVRAWEQAGNKGSVWQVLAQSIARRHPRSWWGNGPQTASQSAYQQLLKMGASPAAAKAAVRNIDYAAGGRIPGQGLQDTMPVGGFAAPGELVVNRHTEQRANALLAAHGTSLGGLVGTETKRHSDFAKGGRVNFGGHPAIGGRIAQIVGLLEGRFPGLGVTATTDGRHVAGSYHYKGMAADMSGSPGLMNTAGAWIQAHLAGQLIEGIHNNTLSVKNGKPQSAMFWGPQTWAAHLNHIHLAAAGASVPGLGQLPGGGGGTAPTTSSAGRTSITAAFQRQRNAALLGVMGLQGLKIPTAAAAGGGTAATSYPLVGTGGTPAQNRALGHRMMLAHGYGEGQWPFLDKLWTRESNWSQTADTRRSGLDPLNSLVFAYGIPQARPETKYPRAGRSTGGSDPQSQINWGLNYISGRYGTPSAAWAHEQANNWYAQGGRVKWGGWHASGLDRTYSTPTLIGVGDKGKERVTVTPAGRGGGRLQATFHIYEANDPAMVRREVLAALETFTQHLEHMPVEGSDLS